MKRVLYTERMHPCGPDLLATRPDIEVVYADDTSPEGLAAAMPGTHAIAVRTVHLTADILSNANDLKVVSRHGVGCDSIAVDHLSGRGIPVAIAAGANARSVTEHTMAFLLALARQFPAQDAMVRAGRWQNRNDLRAVDLDGATILIVGFGRIGRMVAPLCKAFGMNVVVADIDLDRDLAKQMGCRAVTDFHDELANADFITLHVPLDDKTRHLIGPAEFAAMKKGTILVNCARGGIVDDDALVAALDSGQVLRAGLDVMTEEPPAIDHPLIKRDDVILTPHNGAGSYAASELVSLMTAQNILDYFDGCLHDDNIFNLDGLKQAS